MGMMFANFSYFIAFSRYMHIALLLLGAAVQRFSQYKIDDGLFRYINVFRFNFFNVCVDDFLPFYQTLWNQTNNPDREMEQKQKQKKESAKKINDMFAIGKLQMEFPLDGNQQCVCCKCSVHLLV